MVELKFIDPTLAAADAALEERENARRSRYYLGMSSAGDCGRKQAYRHSMVGAEPFSALTLKNFQDGHRTEDLIIERLRMAPGVTVMAEDPDTGRQFEVEDHERHFLGHLDGEIFGLHQAPKTPHVLEIKCVKEKGFNEFKKIKDKVGEKNTLREWNETYYAQHQLYMLYRGRTRGYMVVASAGGRDWASCRTEFNREAAEFYVERARQIIFERDRLPDRISENVHFWKCRWCEFSAVCHDGSAPARNCRTCVWSLPVEDGKWHCRYHDRELDFDAQRAGCDQQRYRPAFVAGDVVAINDRDNTISYRRGDEEWTDRGEA
jgi:hypothetical protein